MQLPNWTKELAPLYCAWRLEKRNNRRRMHWYRKICAEKLRLAEQGINQEKIRLACRFLSNADFVRGKVSLRAMEQVEYLHQSDRQLVIDFLN